MWKVILPVLVIFSIVSNAVCGEVEDARNDAWKRDVDFFVKTIKNQHIDAFHYIPEKVFNEKVDALLNDINILDDGEILIELMKLTRLIGDGHTAINVMSKEHYHFPIRLKKIGDDFYVQNIHESSREFIHWKLKAINSTPIDKINNLLTPVVQNVENEYSLRESLAFNITLREVLHALKIVEEGKLATFYFINENGGEGEAEMRAVPMREFKKYRVELPRIYFKERLVDFSPDLNLNYDRELNTALLHFAEYPEIGRMLEFAAKSVRELNNYKAENLVIDLRENRGGDFFLGLLLISELLKADTLNWKDGIFVLIGNATFSAGMSNAVQFKRLMNATLVGEPTGANPNGYQELRSTKLPNSKFTVDYSTRRYRFQDRSSSGVIPDIWLKSENAVELLNTDKEINWIVKAIKEKQIIKSKRGTGSSD